jgi:predicted cobalt transporter CbtA
LPPKEGKMHKSKGLIPAGLIGGLAGFLVVIILFAFSADELPARPLAALAFPLICGPGLGAVLAMLGANALARRMRRHA